MHDICILYARDDRQRAEMLVTALDGLGWAVWWDKEIHTGNWTSHVDEAVRDSRCIIPVWTQASINPDRLVINETKHAKDLSKVILPVQLDDVPLPILFNTLHTEQLIGWNGSISEKSFADLFNSLIHVLGQPSKRWNGTRPGNITFANKSIDIPCFVRSVSSYETQLKPDAALEALRLIPTDEAVLVSAYDLHVSDSSNFAENSKERDFLIKALADMKARGSLVIIDSGNYEASRNKETTWNRDNYLKSIDGVPRSFVFSFDNLYPSHDIDTHVAEILNGIKISNGELSLPIVHAPQGKKGRQYELLPQLFFEVANKCNSPIIAVPERELGDGILERAHTVRKIRMALNKLQFYQPIHLLGTGNPISLAVYAGAGADFFDGLEWCRTVVDRNTGLLFHHQQYDFFRHQTKSMARFDFVRDNSENDKINYMLRMALHNLDFMHDWMAELRDSIRNNTVGEMLAANLPKDVYKEIGKAVSEIFKS